MLHQFEQRIFALAAHYDVDIGRLQGLFWKERRVPAAKNDREILFPGLHGARDFDCFADHRTGDQGNRKAESILYLFEDSLFVVRSDRGIDKLYRIAAAKKRGGDRKY